MEWVKIDDYLPCEDNEVLCWDGCWVYSCVFSDSGFNALMDGEWTIIDGVTHWMPFPEGPENEES